MSGLILPLRLALCQNSPKPRHRRCQTTASIRLTTLAAIRSYPSHYSNPSFLYSDSVLPPSCAEGALAFLAALTCGCLNVEDC